MPLIKLNFSISFIFIFLLSIISFSQATDLFISEYSEGSSNNKYVEIFNGTGASVDLSNYQIWRITNGGSWPEATTSMSGTLNDGDVFVVYNGSSDPTIIASGDLSSGVVVWNGDDAVGLAKDISGTMTLIDAVGEDGIDPGSGWSLAGTTNATKDKTIVRKPDICSPNTNWTTSAGTNTTNSEWTVYPQNTWSYIGSHSSNCSSSSATTPSAPTISSIENGAGEVTINFTAGADGGAAITDYEYSIDNGSNFTSMATTSSPYTITGLTNGTDYNIQIRAVNSEGVGTASNTSIGSPYVNEYSITSFNSSVTETFNSLSNSSTSSSLPAGIYLSEQGDNANSTYSIGTGSSGTGDTYSFGLSGDNDRALGGVASGNLQTSFGAKIRNETGTTLNSVVISYTGESWKVGSANRIDQLDFQYSTDATSLEDGTWTDFDNLDYVNTGQSTGSGSIQHTASLNDTLTNLDLADNDVFWIRWNDLNATGADDGMGVDDLSITAICHAGTIATSASNILKGNDITWTYSGTDFFEFEYHWGDNNWSNNWGLTNNPGSWGAGQSGNQAILHVRAEATCGSESDVSNTVTTFWTDCYTEDITATVDGASITNGGDFTINSTVIWTWPTAGTGEGAGHALGYYYDSEPTDNANYSYVWSSSPTSWSNTSGSEFTSTDRLLYVKSRSTGINSCTNYASSAFSIKLKRPIITTAGTLSSFTTCEGSNSTSQSFNVSGNYISNASGITVTAPSGFEVSTDDTNFSGTVNLSASSGNVATSTIYVRLSNSASSGSTSDNVICTATSAVNKNVATSATVTTAPIAGTLSGTETACSNSSTIFSSNGDAGGSWSSASPSVATIDASTGDITPISAGTCVMTYTVTGTGTCAGTDASATRTVTVTAAATEGSLTVDKTEALSTETINWTNSGVTNGTCQYYFQWSNDNTSEPSGSWTPWDVTENQSWASSSAGSNMNRTLWVKTIITASNAGCVDTETTAVFTDVKNCKAGTTTASVSSGTVANMPFGEIITYTAGTPLDGSFERLQYQWNGTSDASWSDWSTNNPTVYTTDQNAGQTLYVRSKIVGAAVNGSATCTDYSNNIQTFLIDCPNTVAAAAGSDVDLCNGSSVALSGSGSGSNVSSYAWSPNTEISSTSSATPTISATSTRTYTLTNTHVNGCTSTDDIVVTIVGNAPTITTATDLTTAANTCGETELTIATDGSGGSGQWTYLGGLVSYNNSSATDATVNLTTQPADVNTNITMTWTVDGGEVCDGSTVQKVIRFNQPTSISSPDAYCYLWGGLNSVDITTGSNWYKWDALKSMWAVQSSAPSTSTDKLHILATDNNCIH
ncbi:MAG: lamin tail domain-containing protein, partial [Crocinitomicaceae bacterium]|nr:lamin tail domain-containing protein [Crocinitomicaceae bacterium]